MDQAMVKRGIGAVVLAIIAALLLGYLLKGKSRDRQEVVDMPLPDTTEMAIPSLGDAPNSNAEANADGISIVGEDAINAGNAAKSTVVASADAVKDTARESFNNVTNIVTNIDEPGFSVRPPNQNETREIVDNGASANDASANNNTSEGSAAIAYSKDPVDEVIASSKQTTKKFKPTIVEEKKKTKKPVKKAAETKKLSKAPAKPTVAKKAPAATTGNTPLGKYSIQLLATSSQSRAGKLADTMKSEGYKVFVTETHSNNKILFRVRVGGHANRDAAVQAQESMKRRYQKNFFIQNSLVISN